MVHFNRKLVLVMGVAAVLVVTAVSAVVLANDHPSNTDEEGGNVGLIARMVNNRTEMQIMVNALKTTDNATQTYPLSSLHMSVVTTSGLEGSMSLGSLAWNGNGTANGTLMEGFTVHMKREVVGGPDLQKFDFIVIDSNDPFEYGVWTINIIHEPGGTRVGGLIMPINGLTCCE